LVGYLPALHDKAADRFVAENINVIAQRIFVQYSLPFEIAGLLLLLALIGAAVTTSHLKSRA
jgi:NADH:ubiquinone oxidoreductase subunit 6 (subunit J)